MVTESEARRLQLKWSLQALALPAKDQLAQFPDGVDKTDELAEDLEFWFLAARTNDRLTARQTTALQTLDALLRDMSRGGALFTDEVWGEAALFEDQLWSRVRQLAADALAAFGWSPGVPPLDRRPA